MGQNKILLVEDSEEDFLTTKRAFKKAGVANPIDRVKTGDEALDYMRHGGTYSELTIADRPGLILLDLNLPGTDGRAVLRDLKADPLFKSTPIIVFTTSNDERDIEACYRDGANSYIQKPLDFRGFVTALGRLQDYWFEIAILPKPA